MRDIPSEKQLSKQAGSGTPYWDATRAVGGLCAPYIPRCLGGRLRFWLLWVTIIAAVAGGLAQSSPVRAAENLASAWQEALAVDPRLASAHELNEAARWQATAASSEYRPRLQNRSGYTFLSDSPSAVAVLPGGSGTVTADVPLADRDFVATSTMLQMPLYTGGRIRSATRAAESEVDATSAAWERTILDVKLETAEAYVAVLRAEHLLDVARADVRSLAAHAEDVERMLQQELAARNDWLAARVALADAQQQELVASNTLDVAQATYNRLLSRALDAPVELNELRLPEYPQDLAACVQTAHAQRPELRQLAAQIRGLEHRKEAEESVLRPQFDVSGGFTYLDNSYVDPNGIWSLSFGMEWTPYDGGTARARSNATHHRAVALARQRDHLRSGIALEVRRAWLDTREAQARIGVAEAAVHQGEENLRVARRRFAEGLGTNTEVLDAVRLLSRANHNYYTARYDAILARLRLDRAMGTL